MKNVFTTKLVYLVKGILCLLVFLVFPVFGFAQNTGINLFGAQAHNLKDGFDVNFTSKVLIIASTTLTGLSSLIFLTVDQLFQKSQSYFRIFFTGIFSDTAILIL